MPSSRASMRIVLLTEDKRTDQFFRRVLIHLGFHSRKIYSQPAPRGRGSGEAWVRERYPKEVAVLRTKRHQLNRGLIAVRDGDRIGVANRKKELDRVLEAHGQNVRRSEERIATPVPTWSLETWLLALLDAEEQILEDISQKRSFQKQYSSLKEGKEALSEAAKAWQARAGSSDEPHSLADGRDELRRLDTK